MLLTEIESVLLAEGYDTQVDHTGTLWVETCAIILRDADATVVSGDGSRTAPLDSAERVVSELDRIFKQEKRQRSVDT